MPRVLVAHPSPDVYGSDRQLLESIAGLRAVGWIVTVALPTGGPLVGLLTDTDVRVEPFPVLRKSLLSFRGLLGLLIALPRDLYRLIRVIRQVRPDVLYVNTVTIPWWILAGRVTRTAVIVHVHEAEEDASRVIRIALNSPLLFAHKVIANSRASRQVLAGVLPRLGRRTVVIPNGIADPGWTEPDLAEPGRVALVARLSPRKGVDVALEAIALLRAEGREVCLDVCGTAYPGYEWFEKELRERADEPVLRGSIQFLGYVNPTAPILASAAVVLVPSRVEPFGNTAVEGLLARRPVVASNVQGLAEIINDGQTGVLVPPGNARALATAIGSLLDDPSAARKLADAGWVEAHERFSVERYRGDIATAVDSLTSRRS